MACSACQHAKLFLKQYEEVRAAPTVLLPNIWVSSQPVTDAEIKSVLDQLRIGKAPGPDGIHVEFLEHLGPTATKWLDKLLRSCIHSGRVPDTWRLGEVIPRPKPGKGLSSVNPIG